MGQAVTGAPVQLDACSFNRVSLNSVNFTYYLGSQKINAQAHCQSRTWTTFHDRVTHQPQSTATANMLARVCNSGELAVVFDPPSNIRVSPNGAILCTLRSRVNIKIYGNQGEWHYTDFCGPMGMIHASQIHF
jgi:hypothetical protein